MPVGGEYGKEKLRILAIPGDREAEALIAFVQRIIEKEPQRFMLRIEKTGGGSEMARVALNVRSQRHLKSRPILIEITILRPVAANFREGIEEHGGRPRLAPPDFDRRIIGKME